MFAVKFAVLASIAFVSSANKVPFISNGSGAEIAEFPFLISIQLIDVHVCSGSLLNEKWILTAARCFVSRALSDLNIEYGHSQISPGPNGANKARLSRYILHEEFAQNPLINNIGLAESEIPIMTGFFEPYAKLSATGVRFQSGTTSVHAGFGHIGPGVRNNDLQKADLRTLSHAECLEAVGDSAAPNRENICAMYESVLCTGDVGKLLIALPRHPNLHGPFSLSLTL